jgi:hypothetical protein
LYLNFPFCGKQKSTSTFSVHHLHPLAISYNRAVSKKNVLIHFWFWPVPKPCFITKSPAASMYHDLTISPLSNNNEPTMENVSVQLKKMSTVGKICRSHSIITPLVPIQCYHIGNSTCTIFRNLYLLPLTFLGGTVMKKLAQRIGKCTSTIQKMVAGFPKKWARKWKMYQCSYKNGLDSGKCTSTITKTDNATTVDIQQSQEGDSVYNLTTVTFSQKGSSSCLDLSSVDGYGPNKARTTSSAA